MSQQIIQSLISGIADAAQDYDPSNPATASTRAAILKQTALLLRTVASPADLVGMQIDHMMELVAIRTLMDLKVFQNLPDSGSITLDRLSKLVDAEDKLVGRLLRMAVACQLVEQLPDLSYASTKFSRAFAMDPGPGLALQFVYDESFTKLCRFHLYLGLKGRREPDSQFTSPYAWTENQEGKAIWEIMSQYPERLRTFQRGLPFLNAGLPKVGYYDFSKLAKQSDGDRTTIVDIGGGSGQTLTEIMAAHPEIDPKKVVIQDLPPVIAVAEDAKKRGELHPDIMLQVHDFYQVQVIKGAKAYYFGRILHDYSDTVAIEILKQLVPAMAPDSIVLISDFVLPDRITPEDIEAAAAGILILTMAGKERSVSEIRAIIEAAGLQMIEVYKPASVHYGLVEARLPQAAK